MNPETDPATQPVTDPTTAAMPTPPAPQSTPAQALTRLLANLPDNTPANWLAHCLPRLFFWRAVSLRWQAASPAQRQHLNTVLHLSEATLYPVIANPAAFDIAPAPLLLQQANRFADTLADLCQAQTDPADWRSTLTPDQFRPQTAEAAHLLIRLQQSMAQLWPEHDSALAISVFNGMLSLLQLPQATPDPPPEWGNLLLELLQPQATDIIFDPCCGYGSLLGRVARHLQQAPPVDSGPECRQALLIGEDQRPDAVALARLNLALHDWGYVRLTPRHHPELLGLRLENNQPLWANVVLAVLPADAKIDLAWHALESLHPEHGRMALVLPTPLLANDAGQAVLRFLTGRNRLHAVIAAPQSGLPGHKYPPSCLFVDYRTAASSVAVVSGRNWQAIRQAWQTHLTGGTSPNCLMLNSTTARKHKPRLNALPFAPIWAALRQQYGRS